MSVEQCVPNPFTPLRGCKGVVVRFADKQWYLREWHSHNTLEMNLVVRGSGSVLLEDRTYPLLPGHMIWLWPGQRHIPAQWSSDMLMWIVEWRRSFIPTLRNQRTEDGMSPDDHAIYCCRRLDSRTLQRMQGVLSGVAGAERVDTFNEGLQFALLSLWDVFLKAKPVASETFLHPKLETVLNRLNDPANGMTLEQLGENVSLSPSHLSVLFRRQTGLSMPDYRNRLRLNAFFALYREQPEMQLLSLALEAGFGSYAQFYRVFTQSVGQPPREWLKSVKE